MNKTMKFLSLSIMALILWITIVVSFAADEVTVTVDPGVSFQTIDGFGAHGAMNVWWSEGPFYNQAFLDRIIDDLGLTIIRNEYYPPEDGDRFLKRQAPYLTALKVKAEASGEPLKFITTFWTPPGRMKDNGNTKEGGHLKPECYEEFGAYAVSAVKAYEEIGINLYALSLQNEPSFKEPYNSCEYTRDEYRDMLKVAGPIIHSAYPEVKLFGAEHMLWALQWRDVSYEGAIMADPDAMKEIGIWACHGYGNDGITPDPKSGEAKQWSAAMGNLLMTKRPLWMTETSGYRENWTDALQLAKSIYAALKYGRVSAWIWWQISEDKMSDFVLMNLGKPGKRYYISKHFYRYIRPGAVMVGAKSEDPELLTVAFRHDQNRTLTVVLINTGKESRQVNLESGEGLPEEYKVYLTTTKENCGAKGTVKGKASVPGSSVMTLVGEFQAGFL